MRLIINLFKKKKAIDKKALKHSTVGEFTYKGRMKSGGHTYDNIKELNKRNISFEYKGSFDNGVHYGNVNNHTNKFKREKGKQLWFPSTWTKKDVKKAGKFVLKGQKLKDGEKKFKIYKNILVGVIWRNGRVATIFPAYNQTNIKRSRKNGRKRNKQINK